LQSAIVQSLGRNFDPRIPGLLLGPWKSYSPALRGQVLDTLFSRPMWTRMTLDAIEKKTLPAHEIDAVRRQRLLSYKDAQVRAAAARVFAASSNPDRGKVLDLYTVSLPEKTDLARGAKLFVKACATCHKLNGVGQNVGPDLASVGDKSVQGLLTAILDPNRAVESRYINYQATTKKGLTFSGILSAETSTTITLTANDGKTHQLLRNELEDLSSTGKSLMPEGLEKDLSVQDVADIIAYVRGNVATRKQFPGNEPKTLTPDKNGRLRLTPASAAIFGPSLVLEKKYGNLGYWMDKDDHAIWTVELAKETSFSCWLDFACPADNAGNTLAIICGPEKLTYKVEATGSWDLYQYQFVPGTLKVPAGKHEIVVRGENFVRGALLDLKEIELRPR
jgi:putative heme-binding domain-containing protein